MKDLKDINGIAARYRMEMMSLYSKSREPGGDDVPSSEYEKDVLLPRHEQSNDGQGETDVAAIEENGDNGDYDDGVDINVKYPEPDLSFMYEEAADASPMPVRPAFSDSVTQKKPDKPLSEPPANDAEFAQLTVAIRTDEGCPIGNATVVISSGKCFKMMGITGRSGNISAFGLPAEYGEYTVSVIANGFFDVCKSVLLRGGKTTDLVLNMKQKCRRYR